MIRQLLCRPCYNKQRDFSKEDKAAGWLSRHQYVSVIVPAKHGITVNEEFMPMPDCHCDLCDEVITGKVAVAVTQYRLDRDGVPSSWEHDYGTVLPDAAVEMEERLTK